MAYQMGSTFSNCLFFIKQMYGAWMLQWHLLQNRNQRMKLIEQIKTEASVLACV